EDLDQAGLLVRLFPEWSRVRNRPQRNAYHRFTVDRHLLEAAAEAASLVRRVHRPDLLLLAALFHDLGKGSPGDHSLAGAALVGDVGPRLGLPPDDVARLGTLVGHHLLLADTATRRDPSDPATTQLVASAVGDRETLGLLAALTEADAAATGPWAWTPWKRALVADLVTRTERVLAGEHPQEPPTFPLPRHRELVTRAASGLVVLAEDDRLTVAAPDRPGLLSLVAGVLALEGLEVVAADAWSGEGVAVSEYTVTPELGGTPDWDQVAARLREVSAAPGSLGPALAARARSYARRRRVPTPGPRVRVDLGASTRATVVEVWAADEVGLLHRLAGVFADLGLDIRHAKVQTLGHEVVDTFYLVDGQGRRVTAPGALATLERAVVDTLGGGPPPRLAEREPDPAP
ncbi:MAG TPA: ACT domain-containing protein, partial [Acidimicrobiales bacterium]|nr:ACT domain-containing protein [Acidimicrobiales bacterium]